MSKKRRKKDQQQRRNIYYAVATIIGVLVIGGLYLLNANGGLTTGMAFRDIHGMSFTPNGELYVATHDGLRVFQGSGWSTPDIPANDYMGYSGTADGFYSSGHPGAGSNMPNPLGLVRSADNGQTLQTIDFAGETDFHVMSASYSDTDVVYVFNPAPNSRLSAGMHYTTDGGETWNAVAAEGLSSQPYALAVNPTRESVVAVAAGNGGTLLSTNYGETFERISGAPSVAVAFDVTDENTLYFGYQMLSMYALDDGSIEDVSVPEMNADAAMLYIASDPTSDDIAIATSEWDVYLWDGEMGSQWRQIVDGGNTV